MKLIYPLLAILPLLSSARPYKSKKPDQKPWAYKIAFITANNRLVSSSEDKVLLKKRQPQHQQNPPHNPKIFSPWSRKPSHPGSPYLPPGGLSIMTDNLPNFGEGEDCPDGWLECGNCPSDPQCWRYDDLADDKAENADEDEKMNTEPDPSSTSPCPLKKCHTNTPGSPSSCGANADCVVNHCVCARGFKGGRESVRGYTDLQAVTVWVDTGVDCDVRCDELSCAEVEQVDVCFQRIEGGVIVMPGEEGDDGVGESEGLWKGM
ncbi:hypothetical protein PTMSG1_01908 [Pyrenophora teres f. maculata]|nr:hypothetical protein PTMSG1_01908 [Pyrenophora teres f. maculata]